MAEKKQKQRAVHYLVTTVQVYDSGRFRYVTTPWNGKPSELLIKLKKMIIEGNTDTLIDVALINSEKINKSQYEELREIHRKSERTNY